MDAGFAFSQAWLAATCEALGTHFPGTYSATAWVSLGVERQKHRAGDLC
jgi:hypothetical protein